MRSTLTRTILAIIVPFLMAPIAPLSSVSQSISMIYGDSDQKPVFVTIREASDYGTYAFLTCARSGSANIEEMGTRRFLRIASYWNHNVWKKYYDDPRLLPELKPQSANQHGRLYIPTRDEPAVVVTTDARIESALPIPTGLDAFSKSCVLTVEDVSVARRLGIPGF